MTVEVGQPPRERRVGPAERLERLCDPGSVHVVRSQVKSGVLGERAREGDGVVAAAARIQGRPVFCYAENSRFAGGSLGEAHADTILRVLELADRARVPVVGLIESAGARLQEGTAALSGYARIFRKNVELSGRVPQISVLTGTSAGGGCYSPALTDFVIMARSASMFLTGPAIVREAIGEDVTAEELGGSKVQSANGVCHFVTPTHLDAVELVRDLLSYLPQNASEPVALRPPEDPEFEDPGAWVPAEPHRAYDVRDVIRSIVDRGQVLEVAPRWARNIVTALCRLDGRAIGVIANQPGYLGGVLDADAATKGARFVRTCSCFGLPLVALVDTPGFMPGSRQERAGVIRHGAKLVHAFAAARVPKMSIVLRKAYGGAYITMNAKDLGADFSFAWPGCEIGIMAARQAVGIAHRREIADASPEEVDRLVSDYAEQHLSAQSAVRGGFIDEIIEPTETRVRLCDAFATLEQLLPQPDGHGSNIPL